MKTTNFERFLMYTILIGGLFAVWFIKDLETHWKVMSNILNLITLGCVSYLDNTFWKPRNSMVTHYLFGEAAVRMHADNGMEGLIKAINDIDLDHEIYRHHESDGSMNLICEYDGWDSYTVITEDEYIMLLAMEIPLD